VNGYDFYNRFDQGIVLNVYIDVDNNESTGIKRYTDSARGFEYRADLYMCIYYEGGGTACAGRITNAKPTDQVGAMEITRFKGDSEFLDEDIVLSRLKSLTKPVPGQVIEASFDYAVISVKSGQVIRLCIDTGNNGVFPVVLLTLK
jgi:hypothetical protein